MRLKIRRVQKTLLLITYLGLDIVGVPMPLSLSASLMSSYLLFSLTLGMLI